MPGLSVTVAFFILCMTLVILLFNFAGAQMNTTQLNNTRILNSLVLSKDSPLHIEPFPIDIKVPAHTAIPPFNLQIFSKKNITNVETHFSGLMSDKPNNVWIPKYRIVANPKSFDVVEGKIIEMAVILNTSNITGSYHGIMTFSYPGGISQYPIAVNIFEDVILYVYLIVVLALGVLAAFFVRLIRVQNELRQDALNAFNDSRKEMIDAQESNRLDTKFDTGISKVVEGLHLLELGFFTDAKETFDAATHSFKSSKKIKTTESEIPTSNYEIPTESKILTIAHRISGSGLTKSLKQDNAILYLITSILLFVGIIQVWITILPKLLPLVNSVFLYLSTFLAGYGSQSILGEIVELARR